MTETIQQVDGAGREVFMSEEEFYQQVRTFC